MAISPICPTPTLDLPSLENKLLSTSTIDKICGNFLIPAYDKEQTALVLVLAHRSGWSAELIANSVNEQFYTWITAEAVWDVYNSWAKEHVNSRNGPPLEILDPFSQDISLILKQFKIEDSRTARRLNQTPRPVSSLE